MSNPLLHVKDAYFFEVPKFLWPRNGEDAEDFPEVWVRLDDQFQGRQAKLLAEKLVEKRLEVDSEHLIEHWRHWQHADHINVGRTLPVYLDIRYRELRSEFEAAKAPDSGEEISFENYVAEHHHEDAWLVRLYEEKDLLREWRAAVSDSQSLAAVKDFAGKAHWSPEKVAGYNRALSGKILIPQPFGRLRNLHEPQSGFCISKFMVLQIVAAMLVVTAFSWLARRIVTGERPRGRIWNLLEAFLLFVRDQIARPAMGKADGDKFAPLLWTIFHFILIMNLLGMLPWAGAATGSLSVTSGMAFMTFAFGLYFGVKKFGFVGWVLNQAPHMELPWWVSPVIKPVVLALELLGLAIKHCVLSLRLMANMFAGHVVLVTIMGMVVGAQAIATWADVSFLGWFGSATATLVGCAVFSVLELFVAFLQAFIFTFLSAIFLHAATHAH